MRFTTRFGQRIISTIFTQSNQYRVILEADPDAAELGRLAERHLSAVGRRRAGAALGHRAGRAAPVPLEIDHLGQFPSAIISFDVAPGYSLGAAVNAVQQARDRCRHCPPASRTQFQGSALAFQSALGNEVLLILAAIVTVYIVLGVLYESFIHPVTILSTLPSAGVGALLALIITGHDLNIVSIIGIILLIGIVKKNAIMMIDFALEAERNEGKSPREAIHQAALLRFRPILMTTVAALFGALPLMLGTRHGLGAAPSAGHLHRRRSAGQPASDAVHHAGDLHLFRPAGRRELAAAAPAARDRRDMNFSRVFIRAADRHHPADDGAGAGRAGRLFPAAGRAAAQHRHAGDLGRAPRCPARARRPCRPAWRRRSSAISASIADVDEMTSSSSVGTTRIVLQFDIRPRHRRRGARRAGRDQCGARRSAGRAALQSDLSQDQSGGPADPDPGADLRRR